MWRTEAMLALLYEDVAGLPRDETETAAGRAEGLARARRRALIVVVLDWLAILVLVLFGQGALLSLGPSQQTAFTLAILAVATHAGFRLGQLEKLRAAARAGDRLAARDPDG